MNLTKLIVLAIPAVMFSACKQERSSGDVPKRTVFFDKTGMDTCVKPGDNFFLYASGKWLKNTVIPPSETGWGSFYVLSNGNEKNLNTILLNASKNDNAKGSKEQMVADLYTSGMDTVTIEKLNYEPVKPMLLKIAAIKNHNDLLDVAADGYKEGSGSLLGFSVGTDEKISTKHIAHFDQAGLGLPNRDYYFNDDVSTVKIRVAYVKYIAKLFALTGTDTATATRKANAILKLETEIAKSHLTPTELRDPVKNYNKFTVTDLQKQVPDINLKDVLDHLGLKADTVLVGQPAYFKVLDNLLKKQPIEIWKDKLRFSLLNESSTYMSKAFRTAHFDFSGRVLNGQKQPRERWKTVTDNVDASLGELLGQLYVEKYFTPEAKERMLALVNNLIRVYKDRIEKLDWMSNETKKNALEKLAAFTRKIGYPDKWKKYDDVEINKNAYFADMVSVGKHDYKEMIGKIGKPVDKAEWAMTPPTVNAYYNPTFNEIVFPAGILQFPFFDKDADDAINYGAIGAVIGHEMTHGFDDEGRQYDKDGNLKDWWTKEDRAKFKSKVNVMIGQYNQFTVLNNLHVNGGLTQGENLADIGGVAIAYQAFKNTSEGKSTKKINGFTPDQRFFLSYAQLWRVKNRDETTRMAYQR